MAVDIPCDVQQIDASGHVFAFVDEARDPEVIGPGAVVIAGDAAELEFARVVTVTGRGRERLVHLTSRPGPRGTAWAPQPAPT